MRPYHTSTLALMVVALLSSTRCVAAEESSKPAATTSLAPLKLTAELNALELPAGLTLGQCAGVAVDDEGNLFLYHRGKQPILRFDPQGKFVRSWGDPLIGSAHGMRIDPQGNLWVTDIGRHTVHKFTRQGDLLLTLGEARRPGAGERQFNKPTDVAFGADGAVYIADGYGNSRVMKFSADGKFLTTWGTPGKGPGEFHLPHSIRVDSQGRVLVGDRENNRVQVFDSAGKLLAIWPGFAPYGLALAGDGTLLVADGRANQVLRVSATGEVLQRIGSRGAGPAQFQMPHGIHVTPAGVIYVAEVNGRRLQRLTPAE